MTKKTLRTVAELAVLALPALVFAQGNLPPAPDIVTNTNDFFGLMKTVVNFLFALLIVLAVVFVILAAFKYLTAGGDPEKVKAANHQIMYAAIAVVIAVLARGVPRLVCSFIPGCVISQPGGFQ